MNEQIFTIRGMDCANCAQTVQAGVAGLPGVTQCELSFLSEKLRVSGSVSPAAVTARVRELGYDVAEPPPAAAQLPDVAAAARPRSGGLLSAMLQRPATRSALLALLLVLPGLILHEVLGISAWWIDGAALLALLLTIGPVARSAWANLRINRTIGINALMVIAAVGALIIGATVEAGVVLVLYSLGEALEGYTAAQARNAIGSLLQLVPTQALRICTADGQPHSPQAVPVEQLQRGDVILVRPGEVIPTDGCVLAGSSLVNQAAITGESRPVDVLPDSQVYAGTINGFGSLDVAVTQPAAETTLARMIRLVEQAQERRAPLQRLVDRFAARYTPAVVVLALLTAVIPPLLWGAPFFNPSEGEHGWLYRALTLLVVACPCALVISTPVTLVSALSAAARHGVLIKGGAVLEALNTVRAVVFDKTGTLTTGRPTLVGLRAVGCREERGSAGHCAACDDVLLHAAAVEHRSEHPLAYAIATAVQTNGLSERVPIAADVSALFGRGVRGTVAGVEVVVASHRFFDAEVAHSPQHCAAASADAGAGMTPLLVSRDGMYLGMLTVADTVRRSGQAAISALRRLRLTELIMLTGDERVTAERIAGELGVNTVRSELLPEQKLAEVEALQQKYGAVLMVGDGVNDAAALAAAHVGIAIGSAHGGTNQAMETADITLLRDDLQLIPFVLTLSRRAVAVVHFNVIFSIAVKLLFLVAVLSGFGSMWLAVLADVGASLLVTLNGMRLLAARPPHDAAAAAQPGVHQGMAHAAI